MNHASTISKHCHLGDGNTDRESHSAEANATTETAAVANVRDSTRLGCWNTTNNPSRKPDSSKATAGPRPQTETTATNANLKRFKGHMAPCITNANNMDMISNDHINTTYQKLERQQLDATASAIVSISDCETTSRTTATSITPTMMKGVGVLPSTNIATIPRTHPSTTKHYQQQQQQRPILVGYAFGPKKMNTMSVVMAEATQAVSTVVTHILPNRIRENRKKKRKSNHNDAAKKIKIARNNGGSLSPVSIEIADVQNVRNYVRGSGNSNGYDDHSMMEQKREIRLKLQKNDDQNEGQFEKCDSVNTNAAQMGDGQSQHQAYDDCSINSHTEVESINNTSCITATTYHSSPENDITCGASSTTISCTFPTSKANINNNTINNNSNHSTSASISTSASLSASTSLSTSTSFKPFPGKYIQIPQHYQRMRVDFVPLDLNSPLEEQHGGKFDAILHKMTEDILCKSQLKAAAIDDFRSSSSTTTTTTSSSEYVSIASSTTGNSTSAATKVNDHSNLDRSEEEAMKRIQRLLKYKNDHPACCLVDHPSNVEAVMSRSTIAHKLTQCLRGITTKSGTTVLTPRYLVLQNYPKNNDASNILKQIDNAPFTYPFIAKPLTAAGTSESHRMGILLGRNGVPKIHTPCILQEYANHDGLLYKVYVLGSRVWVFPRPSLPNLPMGETISSDTPHYVDFDSQRPYPKISDFGVVVPSGAGANPATTTANSDDDHFGKQDLDHNKVTSEDIRPVADCIRRAFGLELFGFDIIVMKKNTKKQMFVVDVNYFPSYKEVTNFSELLAQYLAQCGIEGRVRSFESER